MNPLLQEFNTPFSTAPFGQIKKEHYLPALKEALVEAKETIKKIGRQRKPPTFENTLEELENSTDRVDLISEIFFNIHSAEADDGIQEIAKEFSPLLAEFSNHITHDAKLFLRIKQLFEKKDELSLAVEQKTLLERTYQEFIRGGALLDKRAKNKFKKID
ncbi:MAG: M3 family peptidase, partial [Pseudomonadota bacterium]